MARTGFGRISRDWFLHNPGAVTDNSSRTFVAHDVSAVCTAAAIHAVGFRLVHLAAIDKGARDRCADALQKLGFLIVRAKAVEDGPSPAVKGRHVAVIVESPEARLPAARWVRVLSRQSPRGHLVITTMADDEHAYGPNDAVQARELAGAGPPAILRTFAGTRPDARAARAGRYVQRRRLAAARRWADATVAAARRRGDEDSMVAAAAVGFDLLLERGDLDRALRTARRLRDDVTGFAAVAIGTALLARALVLAIELDAAEALLAGVHVEAALRSAPPPDAVAFAARELCVWRGRFEEAVGLSRTSMPRTPAEIGGAALTAWAAADRDLLWSCQARIEPAASRGDPLARFWGVAIAALRATLSDAAEATGRWRSLARELVATAPPGLAALAQALALELHVRTNESLDRHRPPAHAPPMFRLLLEWMLARAARDEAGIARLAARARHLGVDGLDRWGRRDSGMQLLHDWPTLLHTVHEAEDELSALVSGCAWVRRQGRARGVAVVDANGTSWIASDGWSRDELAHPDVRRALAAPAGTVLAVGPEIYLSAGIRYAGRPIGRVLARGAVEARATLEHAVLAFAAIAAPAVRARLDMLAIARAAHVLAPEIIGHSAVIDALRDAIARAAGTVFPVLVEGESGTGKELVARALHRLSPRRDRSFCAVNCAAFTDELFEAELFGYARGAFTGAVGARAGLVEEAHEGTLFLDEVGDLSARAQAKLLRTLQEREVRRLGENAARRVDVRVVSATNVPLADAIAHGRFREDLLFRLAVIRIKVPPLRDRSEDIPLIAQSVWRRLSAEAGKHVRLGPDAMAALCRHHWPGNIRELQNVLAAIVVLAPARGRVGQRHVAQVLQGEPVTDDAAGLSLGDGRRQFERRMIVAALARHGGQQSRAAHELGLTRQGLAKAMRRLDLNPGTDTAGVA